MSDAQSGTKQPLTRRRLRTKRRGPKCTKPKGIAKHPPVVPADTTAVTKAADWNIRGRPAACALLDTVVCNSDSKPLLPSVLTSVIVGYSELAFHCVLDVHWRTFRCHPAVESPDGKLLGLGEDVSSASWIMDLEDKTLCPVLTYLYHHLHTPAAQEAIILLSALLSHYFPVRVKRVNERYAQFSLNHRYTECELTKDDDPSELRQFCLVSVQPPDPDSVYGVPWGCGDLLFRLRYEIERDGYAPSVLKLTTRLGAALWRPSSRLLRPRSTVEAGCGASSLQMAARTPMSSSRLQTPRLPLAHTLSDFSLSTMFVDEQDVVFGRAVASGNVPLVQYILQQTPHPPPLDCLGFVLNVADFNWDPVVVIPENRACWALVREYLDTEFTTTSPSVQKHIAAIRLLL